MVKPFDLFSASTEFHINGKLTFYSNLLHKVQEFRVLTRYQFSIIIMYLHYIILDAHSKTKFLYLGIVTTTLIVKSTIEDLIMTHLHSLELCDIVVSILLKHMSHSIAKGTQTMKDGL